MPSVELFHAARGEFPLWARITLSSAFALWGTHQLWSAGRCLIHALDSALWPCVRGRIVASEIVSAPSGDGHVRPRIEYCYTVQGNSLSGECIAFGLERQLYGSSSFAWHYLKLYPPGSTVYVYYDPARPDVSVLEPGLSLRAFYPLLFGLLLIGGAAMMAFAPFQLAE